MTAADPDRGWRMSPVFVLRHAGMPFEWLEQLGVGAELLAAADRLVSGADGGADAGVDSGADGGAAEEFRRGYEHRRQLLRARLRELAGQEEFRAAVLLSNPTVHDGMLRGYLARDPVPDTSRFRRVERQVYLYLQRFCGKNETTSTFGPMGYGEVDGGSGLRVERVPVRRQVQLARWALEEVARAVARDPELRVHVPLRRSRLVTDATLPEGVGGPLDETAGAAWALLGGGPATPAELAARTGLPAARVVAAVRPLLARGAVHRGLVFPAEVTDGLPGLRAAVAALPAGPAVERWLAELDGFAADCVAFAAADLAGRQALLARLESRFSLLTGAEPRRAAGDIYADRMILFEEAGSPFRLRVGADLARAVERSVAAGLDLSAEAGQQAQAGYRRQVAGVLREAGGALPFPEYAERARPADELRSAFGGEEDPLVVPAGGDVQLAGPPPEAVTPGQRYALPDLCLLGPDPAAVSASPRVLLARVHHHLLLNGWLTAFAEDPGRIDAQARAWLTGTDQGRMTAALAATRRNKGFYRFPGPRVLVSPVDPEDRPGAVPATALTVSLDGDRPCLRRPDGTALLLYPTLADLSTYPPVAALTSAPVLHRRVRPVAGALGRVHVGGAVYQRAAWELPLADLAGRRGAAAFLAVRALAVRLGLPRFVFVRVAGERKPVLIDTCSPFAVDLLCHLARDHATGRAEEMLPGPEDLWLADERGRYTCELRVQFLRRVPDGEAGR